MIVDLIGVSLPAETIGALSSLCSRHGLELVFRESDRAGEYAVVGERRLGNVIRQSGAHTELVRFDGCTLARDIAGGAIGGEHGIRSDKGMRIARDEIVYNELTIERCVRAACELGSSKILLVCKPNILISSRMWARITPEVCADYSVTPHVTDVEDFLADHGRFMREYGVILSDSLIGDILKNYLTQLYSPTSQAYIGDTVNIRVSDGSTRSTACAAADMIRRSCGNDILDIELRNAISNKS